METQINKTLLHKLLENPRIPEMNMMEVVNFIYDATYLNYSMKFFEELALREKYEGKVIQKVREITDLEIKITNIIDTVREYVPAEVIATLTEPAK